MKRGRNRTDQDQKSAPNAQVVHVRLTIERKDFEVEISEHFEVETIFADVTLVLQCPGIENSQATEVFVVHRGCGTS